MEMGRPGDPSFSFGTGQRQRVATSFKDFPTSSGGPKKICRFCKGNRITGYGVNPVILVMVTSDYVVPAVFPIRTLNRYSLS